MGLIKDNKEPKKIKIDNDIWYLHKKSDGKVEYIDNETSYWDSCTLNFEYYIENNKLNDKVEILPEENDEWEDIEECSRKEFLDLTSDEKSLELYCYIRDLIKNQKYLKERIDKK